MGFLGKCILYAGDFGFIIIIALRVVYSMIPCHFSSMHTGVCAKIFGQNPYYSPWFSASIIMIP